MLCVLQKFCYRKIQSVYIPFTGQIRTEYTQLLVFVLFLPGVFIQLIVNVGFGHFAPLVCCFLLLYQSVHLFNPFIQLVAG